MFFALLVLFEVLAHFSEDKHRERILEKIALCFFAVAVFAEIAAYPYGQRNDTLSEQLIGSLDTKARDAFTNASSALTKSGKADTKADAAVSSATNALDSAKEARREADTFENDIVSAKQQATAAESHLAEALKQAAEATEELNRLKTPRLLTNPFAFSAGLTRFKGTQYTFKTVVAEQEPIDLLKAIDSALQAAQWKREKPTGTVVVNVYGDKVDFGVPPGVSIGVVVEVDSTIPAEQLNLLPEANRPPLVKVAIALQAALNSSISPSQADVAKSVIALENPSPSPILRILVGKKP